MAKPIIGVSAPIVFNRAMYSQRTTYADAIDATGGRAVYLPCYKTTDNVREVVEMLDGLVVPGGADVEPTLYREERLPVCGTSVLTDDEYDIALIKETIRQGKPILAICRGMQIMNVIFGGTLYQDIPSQYGKEIFHSMLPGGVENYHTMQLDRDSHLAKILGDGEIRINTSHHQAVKDLAEGFRIVGRAPDGIPEAMENEDGSIPCHIFYKRFQEKSHCRKRQCDPWSCFPAYFCP
ncbi:MAG: gamma-glutamyl-gamma-aminobutyrate hydrolase family protein [Lachnospiraceae bacterium]|nr:gamma-glutamyl-gamma-aminobutyrate hydrolase family protein [Lachnospiraceae bacterium]